jgi:enoyl-CoA hydratase
MSDSRIVLDINPPLAIVRFNRPAERNKLSTPTLNELDAALTEIVKRRDVRAIIFTGTGDVFASGADIGELRALTVDTAHAFARRGQKLFQRIADSQCFTIAAINGYCMGGALDLALSCRLRFAAPDATFAHPGASLGIITGWSGTQRLPALIGGTRALEMFLTARRLMSAEALAWGLVHRVCEKVVEESIAEVECRLSGD